MVVREFYDLIAWKKAHAVTLDIYRLCKQFPKDELFGVVSQLRRASSSVSANIAEGFGRYHYKDRQRFYYHARGSVVEVQNFLFLSRDLQFIDVGVYGEMMSKTMEVKKLINGLIRVTNVDQIKLNKKET